MIGDLGLLALRVVLGLVFLGHGAQKAFGAFGGPGLAGASGFMASLGLPSPASAPPPLERGGCPAAPGTARDRAGSTDRRPPPPGRFGWFRGRGPRSAARAHPAPSACRRRAASRPGGTGWR